MKAATPNVLAILLAATTVLILDATFAVIVQVKLQLPLDSRLTWATLFDKLFLDTSVFLIGIGILSKYRLTKALAFLFALFFCMISSLDCILFFYANTTFKVHLLDNVSPGILKGYLSTPVLFIMIATVMAGVAGVMSIKYLSRPPGLRYPTLLLIFLLATMAYLKPGLLLVRQLETKKNTYHVREERRYLSYVGEIKTIPAINWGQDILQATLEGISANSILNVVDEFTQLKKGQVKTSLAPSSATIDYYDLMLGRHNVRQLPTKPFRRIILVLSESFSLDFCQGYNEKSPVKVTPFLSSQSIRKRMFLNFRTTRMPTHEGLSALVMSHPNAHLATVMKYPTSMVKILRAAGYRTLFLNCCGKTFDNAFIHVPRMGFDEVFSEEEWLADEKTRKYVSGWGLCDRVLFREAIKKLTQAADQKVFMTILTADTHPPDGRGGRWAKGNYDDLEYPAEPKGMESYKSAAPLMRAVFRHDFDLSWFIGQLRKKGQLRDDTLVILTADHGCPQYLPLRDIPGYPSSPGDLDLRIPLVFITTQSLPPVQRSMLLSQLDLAPTILHLLHLPIPKGYWGESIFARKRKGRYVGFFNGVLYLAGPTGNHTLTVKSPRDAHERQLAELFRTIFD